MNMDINAIEKLVKQVIEEGNLSELIKTKTETETVEYGFGIFETMNEAVEASHAAWQELFGRSMADREKYIQVIRDTILKKENLEFFSQATVDETGIGNYEHKIIKNRLAAEKTPGTEDLVAEVFTGDGGITLVEYCPFGVIGSITPTTNPTETVISNAIGMIAGGNTVVFSPHPRSKNVTIKLIVMLNKALEEVGAPKNLITTVNKPSIENTNALMSHELVRLLVATGGPAIVTSVLKSGKKAIGAGAGNPPVVVDETADIRKAAIDIVNGSSFDNNVPCVAEKEVFVVEDVADYLVHHMKNNGAYELKCSDNIEQLLKLVTNEKGAPKVEFVGKSAYYILEKLGIHVDKDVKLIIIETQKDHPFVMEELMMPILPIVRVKNVDEAIECALVAEKGNRHTAIMHSKNVDKLTKMARLLQTTIFVKNAPSYAGIGAEAEGFTTFTIAGPTGEGLTSARSFCRKRRCVLSEGFNIK